MFHSSSDSQSATPEPQENAAPSVLIQFENRFIQYEPLTAAFSSANRRSKQEKDTKGKVPKGRNVGKLAGLMEMPLDVFYEITSHIQPKDMLQLSRSSPYFRELLTTKNARPYWRAARRTIDMPDCPPDLSEMQYASLAFERNCFACGGLRASKVSYILKVRFCINCWDMNIKKGRNLMKPHNEGLKPRFQIKFIISTLVISIEDDPGHLGKYGRSLTPLPSADQKFREKFSFYQPEFLAVLDDYLVVRTEKSALEEFIKERQQIMNDTLKFANIFYKWEKKFRIQETQEMRQGEAEKAKMKSEKKNQIKERLLKEGYTAKDFPAYDYEWDKLLKSRGELTDKYWKTNLFPKLEAVLDRYKKRVIKDKLNARVQIRRSEFLKHFQALELPSGTFRPTISDLTESKFLTPFLEQNDGNDEVTAERFQEIADEIRDFSREFDANSRRMIVDIIHGPPPQSSSEVVDDCEVDCTRDSVLKLAGTILECRAGVCSRWNGSTTTLDHYPGTVEHMNTSHLSQWVWKASLPIKHHLEASNIAERVLESVGLSKEASVEELHELEQNGSIVCLCGKPEFTQPATFSQLLLHILGENIWHRDSQKWAANIDVEEEGYPIPANNDHDPSNLRDLVTVLPKGRAMADLPPPSTALGSDITVTAVISYYCFACLPAGRTALTLPSAIWHINTKHLHRATNSHLTTSKYSGVHLKNPTPAPAEPGA